MGALNENALLMQYGHVYVGPDANNLVDLGAVRNVRFRGEQIRNKINSDNRGTILNKIRINGFVEFDWLEPADVDNLELMFKGLVTKSSVAGSPVSNHSQVVASGAWAYNDIIFFEHQDGDGTAPNIDSVTAGTNGALTLNTDYIVVQHDDGRWGIMVIDSSTVTTLSQTITIQFDYTPAASVRLTGGTSQTATNRFVRIVGPSEDDENVTRSVTLEEAVASSELLLAFVNVEDAGDVGVMPVVMESNKNTEWYYEDEINAS